MSGSDEFVLSPPATILGPDPGQPRPSRVRSARPRNELAEFKILQPDSTLHALLLPEKCTGHDCMDQICEILGIVEKDYFGFQYTDSQSGYRIWINKRLQIRRQIKTRPPYVLFFSVKYYTQPQYILQSMTLEAFFIDLKCQIKRGDIHIPNSKKGLIGARIAQVEMGNASDSTTTPTVYPPYFPNWNSGIAHIIGKEHKKLKGANKREALVLFINAVYDLENYGMTYVRAIVNSEHVIVGIGSKYIRIFTPTWRCKNRIAFSSLTQVAFGNKFFSFIYSTRNDERSLVERKITAYVFNHNLARSLFRTVTEDQVFHYQATVTPLVLNHAETRETLWKTICRKVFKRPVEKRYYYDIQRTKRESYRHNWQILHQVAPVEVASDPPEEPPVIYVNLASNNRGGEEDRQEEDPEKVKKKTEIWWGLSESSTFLAKDLLPPMFVTLSPSRELSLFEEEDTANGGGGATCRSMSTTDLLDSMSPSITSDTDKLITKEHSDGSSEQLSAAQGRKMFRFLAKIQDEKLCNVCMDELISSVFCPCGHYVSCERCAKKLDKCPVCRQPVGYVQFVYIK